ncbi:hypothetical protein [Streptomyces sp. SYSU K21746]
MLPYVGIAVGLIALHAGFFGSAALRWGWLLPWERRHILRTRLYGWGELTIAAALIVYWFGGVLPRNTAIRDGAIAVALLGFLLTMQARRAPHSRERRAGGDING